MTILKYKDYQGSVCFDGDKLVIQILHIDDFITDECDSARDAQKTFQALVEEYLAICAAVGKQPHRPFKGTFNVRVNPELHRKAAQAAASMDLSLNSFVEAALCEKLDRNAGAQKVISQVVHYFSSRSIVESEAISHFEAQDQLHREFMENILISARQLTH